MSSGAIDTDRNVAAVVDDAVAVVRMAPKHKNRMSRMIGVGKSLSTGVGQVPCTTEAIDKVTMMKRTKGAKPTPGASTESVGDVVGDVDIVKVELQILCVCIALTFSFWVCVVVPDFIRGLNNK